MRADCLPEDLTGPACGPRVQAGEVNTGVFDPFSAVVQWARNRQAWVHVDGAFGLWALVDPARSLLTAGLPDADSWATDAHKWLNVPYDCGIALVRRPEDLRRRSFASVAGDLPPDTGFEAMHHTPQASQRARACSRNGRSCARWAGRGSDDLIVRTCDHAQAMAARLRQAGLEVLNDVVLNQVLVRGATDDQTLALVESVQQDGTCRAVRPPGRTVRPCGSAFPAGPRPAKTSPRARPPSSPPPAGKTAEARPGKAVNDAEPEHCRSAGPAGRPGVGFPSCGRHVCSLGVTRSWSDA